MRKFVFMFVLLVSSVKFINVVNAMELRPQFRVWKSSYIGAGSFGPTKISSETIIFHMVQGSATVSSANSSFQLYQSSIEAWSNIVSTKAYLSLDKATSNIGTDFDIIIGSHSYFIKGGIANIEYLWDYLQNPRYDSKNQKD